jgi:endonuclease/exonuclease/phosphatase family metal-dependent hydrolase
VQPTYPSEHPSESIDYAVSDSGTLLEAEVLAVNGSDHLPVLLRVSLTEYPEPSAESKAP